MFPRRRFLVRQPAMRAYNDDLVISNSYAAMNLTDQQGKVTAFHVRSSVAWAKLGGRWQIVDQHTSRLPVAP
jgi:ketosteroid isomerase-like protein